MHRLRVVNFDKPVSEKEVSISRTRNMNPEVHDNERKNILNAMHIPTVKSSIKTEISNTPRVYDLRSNALFKTHRKKSIKDLSSRRTWSFEDVGKKCTSNLCDPKLKHKKRKLASRKKRNISRNRKEYKSQDDIKVIYTSERFKSQVDKNDAIKLSKAPIKKSDTNLYDTRPNNRYLCYQTSRNTGLIPIPKKKRRKPESRTHLLHAAYPLHIKRNHSKKSTICRNAPRADRFSVVGFPVSSKITDKHNTFSKHMLCNDELPLDCKGNAAVTKGLIESIERKVCCGSVENIIAVETQVSNECCSQNCKSSGGGVCCFLEILRTVLMYFLLMLIIVVWLPCIIVGIISWCIISLMRPQDDVYINPKCKKTCKFKNKLYQMNEWVTDNAQRFAVIVRHLMDNENIVITPRPQFHKLSIPAMPCQVSGIRRRNHNICRSKWQPNPGKKYVLFYKENRGWLMKPAKKRVCEHYDRTEIVGHSWHGGGDNKQKRDRTVTFWDSQDHDACKCDHTHVAEELEECTQLTCKDPQTNLPTCGKCHEEIDEPRMFQSKPLITPCPTARPCPPRTLKKILHQQHVARQKEIVKRLSTGARTPHRVNSYGNPEEQFSNVSCAHLTFGQKVRNYFKDCGKGLKKAVEDADEIWGDDTECGSMYLSTLRKRPCFCIHRCCPNMYPVFLVWHKVLSSFCYGCMLICAACVWCPLFFCCYLCFTLLCMCCGGDDCAC